MDEQLRRRFAAYCEAQGLESPWAYSLALRDWLAEESLELVEHLDTVNVLRAKRRQSGLS